MRRPTNNESPIQVEELDVVTLEQRRSSGESAIQASSEALKFIEEKHEAIIKDIEVGKEVISQNLKTVDSIKEKIVILESQYNKKVIELEESFKEKLSSIDVLDKEIVVLESKVETLKSDAVALLEKSESDKINLSQDISKLMSEKVTLENEIIILKRNIEAFKKESQSNLDLLESKKQYLNNLAVEEETLKNNIAALKVSVSDQKSEIQRAVLALSESDKIIEEKKKEIDFLAIGVTKKTEEYNALEKKAFAILEREGLLKQKEAFIKSQYERAGIQYE